MCVSVCLSRPGGGSRGGSEGVQGGRVRWGIQGGVQGGFQGGRMGVLGRGSDEGSEGIVTGTAKGLPRRNAEGGRRPRGVMYPYAECRAVMNIALATHRRVMHRVLLF